jgi:hypothetical protein
MERVPSIASACADRNQAGAGLTMRRRAPALAVPLLPPHDVIGDHWCKSRKGGCSPQMMRDGGRKRENVVADHGCCGGGAPERTTQGGAASVSLKVCLLC